MGYIIKTIIVVGAIGILILWGFVKLIEWAVDAGGLRD